MANLYNVQRCEFVNITLPTSNSTTVSTGSSAYVPAGAIITNVKVHSGDAVTLSQLSNLTFNVYVGTQVVGSNNNIVSAKMVQTVPSALGLASTAGVLVPAGGNIVLHLGSGTSVTGGIAADADIYVEYLYCDDRDDK